MIMASTLTIPWAGQRWELRPEKAVVHQETRTVIVADLHLGKSGHFRSRGIPVPGEADGDTLDRLGRLLEAVAAETLVVLGDFFHSREGVTPDLLDRLCRFRDGFSFVDMVNVRGNHDQHAGDPPSELGIRCLSGPVEDDGVRYCHEPPSTPSRLRSDAADRAGVPGLPVMAGHLHPAVVMQSRNDRLRMPCFRFTATEAVLPAFGTFTGMTAIRPEPLDRIFVVGPGRVADVSRALGCGQAAGV